MSADAHVSVVIPTLRRPKLVLRALDSVFAQTYDAFEVIVVVDGPDDATVEALRSLTDPRLRIIVNPHSLTAAGARNVGVAHATGEWIAFLDDDDEWMPDKLEKQLLLAGSEEAVLVTCLSRVITPNATYVWPEIIYDNAEPIDAYLFDRRGAFAGSACMQTSSFLMPRGQYEKSPFPVPSQHDDWEFLLHQTKAFGVRVETVPEVLVKLYMEEQRPSLTGSSTWASSLAWLDSVRPLLTRRAYSGFCLGVVGPRAANEKAYAALFPLLYRAVRHGSPRFWHVLTYGAFWAFPQNVRRKLRARFRGHRG